MHRKSQRGGVVASILIGTLAVLILTAAGLVCAGWYLARNVRVTTEDRHGQAVRVETPFGSMQVREGTGFDPRRFGVPVYPGAAPETDHHKLASFELDLGSDHKALTVVAAEYTTPDPVDKVRDFYRRELPHWIITEKHHQSLQFEYTEGGYKRIIALRQRDGMTHIGLASVGEPESN